MKLIYKYKKINKPQVKRNAEREKCFIIIKDKIYRLSCKNHKI